LLPEPVNAKVCERNNKSVAKESYDGEQMERMIKRKKPK
jgi:hypothetical protein